MHPTRTTTTLLLGVACAVSAVSGCVKVGPAPVTPAVGPSAGPAPHHEPRGGPGASPVVVQAPALEALKAAPGPAAPSAASAPAGAPAAPQRSAQAPPPVPDIPEPRKPAEAARGDGHGGGGHPGPARSDAKAERELMRELPVRPADVCALGRRHGHWRPDSPESRICEGVHGG
ncbi:hypothetical protein [Streptomyces sp. NPDC096339]|uniref:hypothetical protein n=1 Tax=Streptomyces sp. NPDC096339 TaxID=3366086 RepID=UPI00381BFB44